MATSFSTIEDIALITINDYKIGKLYAKDEDGFLKYCDGFLITAIPNFFQCRQSLEYDLTNREFASDLTSSEISILADLWAIEWLERETQNAAQLANALQTSQSFKLHSPAQHIKEQSTFLDKLREEVDRKLTKYQLEDLTDLVY